MVKQTRSPYCIGSFVLLLVCLIITPARAAERQALQGHVPEAIAHLQPLNRLDETKTLTLAIGLPVRDLPGMGQLLHDLYDPTSPNYRHYLKPAQFAERFGPTPADYQSLIDFAKANGLRVSGTHSNRVVLEVQGSVAAIERALHVTLHEYQHPLEARKFYAPDAEPSLDLTVPILHISGLDNYSLPHPNSRPGPQTHTVHVTPHAGSEGGEYIGNDFRAAYVPGSTLYGNGQSVALLEYDGYYASDITHYESLAGLQAVTLTNILINGGPITPGGGDGEVSLDIELAISMAPNLSQILVYEGTNGVTPWLTILTQIADDDLANQVSCSWSGGSPDPSSEQIFEQMAMQGQSFFNAVGDSDAFTGAIGFPSDSTNITEAGGTTLTTTNNPGVSYVSETVWNWDVEFGSSENGVGSSGGVSTYYAIPPWQQGISMTANKGSTSKRNVPDVALLADHVFVAYDNGATNWFGGTSCAAPLWAAFTALVNQQATSNGMGTVGFLNPALYSIGKSANYTNYFHDVTTGNNEWTRSRFKYSAVTGYDLCTGWGTPNGTNMINALAATAVPSTLLAITPANYNFGALVTGTTAQTSFLISNSGHGTLTGLVTTAGPFAIVSGSPFSVTGLGSINVIVSFTPASLGSFSNSVIVTSNGGDSTNKVIGTGVTSPVISVSPNSLNYGSIVIGQTSNLLFSVINSGQGTLTGTTAVGLPFAAASNASYSVAGGATGQVLISFSPSAAGTVTSNVVFTSTGGLWTNTVTGIGLTPAHLIVNAGTVNFGTVLTNTTIQTTLLLTNSGESLLSGTATATAAYSIASGSSYTITGLGTTNVIIDFKPASVATYTGDVVFVSNSGNLTNVLIGSGAAFPVSSFSANPSSGAVPLTVTFTDLSSGTITDRFWNFGDGITTNITGTSVGHIYTGAGTYTVSLTVSGPLGSSTSTQTNLIAAMNPPLLTLGPASLNFGTLVIGQTSNRLFTVVNSGGLALTGTASVAGAPYSVTAGSSFNLSPEQTQNVTVTFAPLSAGTFNTNLIVTSNGGTSTNALTGQCVTPAQLAVSPSSYNFGAVATGGVAYASFTATNSGGASLNGTASIGVPFAVVTNDSFNLAGFAATNIVVQFAPVTIGTWTSNVVFTSTGGSSTNAVTGVGAVAPLAAFSASPTNGVAPLTVTFTDNSSGTITNRFWQFGDSTSTNISATSVVHTYTVVGTDSVSLTVSGPLGTSLVTNLNEIVVTNVIPQADLALTTIATPTPVPEGQTLTYTLTLANSGPAIATGVTVTDTLPASVTFVSVSPSAGNCTNIGGIISCNLGALGVTSNATVTVEVTTPPPGTITNIATAYASTSDPNLMNNTTTNITTVLPVADLMITGTNTPNPVLTSQNLTYSLVVANLGPSPATGVIITEALPASMTFVSGAASAGSFTNTGGLFTCALGNLANNATATITIVVTPSSASNVTTIANSASVNANEFDPDPGNNLVNFNAEVYLDSIGDGIPDWWRLLYFGSGTATNAVSCATCDPDGDGFSNLQEYLAGTNPTNAQSALKIVGLTPNSADIVVTFDSVIGKSYELDHTIALTLPAWTPVTNATATDTTTQLTDPGAATNFTLFYRIQLIP